MGLDSPRCIMPEQHTKSQYDVVRGSASISPFDPPVQMTAHAASVISLALLCQRRRRERQIIAEVGVWQGQLSRWLLTCLPFATVHLIDVWSAGKPGDSWYDNGDRFAKNPQEQHDLHYRLVAQLCEQFNPRAIQHKLPSLEAAKLFVDGSLDLVFIDGAHDGKNVSADIRAWLPKVRKGGIISGHDYRPGGNYFGLIKAVERSAAELGLELQCFAGKVWAACVGEPFSPRAFIGPRSAYKPTCT